MTRQRDRLRSIAIGGLCAVGFGSWALLANLEHGLASGLKAALVQLCMSFTLSFLIAEGIHAFERVLGTSFRARVATAFVPALLGDVVVVVGHHCAGTPEILRTILPSVVLGTMCSGLYVMWRGRERWRETRGASALPSAQLG